MMFVVKQGSKIQMCFGNGWTPRTASKNLFFLKPPTVADDGDWVFVAENGSHWKLKIAPSLVEDLRIDDRMRLPRKANGGFNKAILGSNGRGASRRRSQRVIDGYAESLENPSPLPKSKRRPNKNRYKKPKKAKGPSPST